MSDRAGFSQGNDGQRGFFSLRRFTVLPPACRLVGLITIETLGLEPSPDAETQTDGHDATLRQVLIHLSGGGSRAASKSKTSSEATARRFRCTTGSRWSTARLPARLDNLRAELQLVLAQTLGQIADGR